MGMFVNAKIRGPTGIMKEILKGDGDPSAFMDFSLGKEHSVFIGSSPEHAPWPFALPRLWQREDRTSHNGQMNQKPCPDQKWKNALSTVKERGPWFVFLRIGPRIVWYSGAGHGANGAIEIAKETAWVSTRCVNFRWFSCRFFAAHLLNCDTLGKFWFWVLRFCAQ